MPRIFDNLSPGTRLLPALRSTLGSASQADFCVGYFNLRGWRHLAPVVDAWEATAGPCRVLIGMQGLPHEELRESLSLRGGHSDMDNRTAHRLRVRLAEQMREQLTIGAPGNEDERGLQRLAAQLRAGRVVVKLFLRHPLHAKLYLLHRDDPLVPKVAYLGSSNLTFAGLAGQGELNIDVLDQDAAEKLASWFEDRWNDGYCVDVTVELAEIIEQSWAREELIPPYHIYLKMAWHLSREARAGLDEFKIPAVFGDRLFDYQAAAVKIAAHHLNRRNGVLIGDVVGLGKTLMATAVARIFEEDQDAETLIICPKNLVGMWQAYVYEYGLRAQVLSLSRVIGGLETLRRYRLVVIDESHNLRNRESKRYRAIREYVQANDSKCILLSATPYNKSYRDLSSQLLLFMDDEQDLGIRPERLIREHGELGFGKVHQGSPRTIAAFDKSEHADDWRDLMRLYLVRRTRHFIQDNYAEEDERGGKFLTLESGERAYFPVRAPKTVQFKISEHDPRDQYARLYSNAVVDIVNELHLARYGLGEYEEESPAIEPTADEERRLADLSRARKRLVGFCRTNMFKRLESSGEAFLQTVERHVLRNYVYLHAIRNGLPLPVGPQDAQLLDTRFTDEEDPDAAEVDPGDQDGQDEHNSSATDGTSTGEIEARAAAVYDEYATRFRNRFGWLRPGLFKRELEEHLQKDSDALLGVLGDYGPWKPDGDTKLDALEQLLTEKFPNQKVLVFSQFADTVRYLDEQLRARGVEALAAATGDSADPTGLARRFSPNSNPGSRPVPPEQELQVLVATDVLSEGQNLQDCAIVVNYDLPWGIVRLIQRAGRVDRIGQRAEEILCYSFLPADGVERIIRLRARVSARLAENAEVVGADETFFEDEADRATLLDLYHEQAGILDDEPDGEVDLASHAYQIWQNATGDDPALAKAVEELPNVVYSSRAHEPGDKHPEGVLVFVRTADGNDVLAHVGRDGAAALRSQRELLAAAECEPDTPARPRHDQHHELVAAAVQHIVRQEREIGGQLGRPSGARYRTYTRLKDHAERIRGQFEEAPLRASIDDIYRLPLLRSAADTLNRQLRAGISDVELADLVMRLRDEDRLCVASAEAESGEPHIICSLGLFADGDEA